MENNYILNKIKGNIIISAQAAKNEPLYNETAMNAMISTIVELGHANILRMAGVRDIKNTKDKYGDNVIIIGITKPDKIPDNYKELVYITPTVEHAVKITEAGADIIAFDSTLRKHPKENIEEIINFIHSKKRLAMADIATFKEAENAAKLGADIISTTLSGYTKETETMPDTPDFELLKSCADKLDVPVILEGKIWTPADVKKAFNLGAHAVVIGSAVTRPHKIIDYFKKGI